MNKYKNFDDETELFLEPIPRWVTHWGFGTMFLIFSLLATGSYFIKYPYTIDVDIILRSQKVEFKIPAELYQEISGVSEISFAVPSYTHRLVGNADYSNRVLSNDSIIIPVKLESQLPSNISYQSSVICEGEIVVERKSILRQIIK